MNVCICAKTGGTACPQLCSRLECEQRNFSAVMSLERGWAENRPAELSEAGSPPGRQSLLITNSVVTGDVETGRGRKGLRAS